MHIVVGTPGAGKSSVLSIFLKKNPEWKVLNYGTLMMEIAKDFGVKDRDELRKSPIKLQKEIQKKVGEELKELSKNRKLILDTHASVKTSKGYYPGLPFNIIRELNVDSIILIDADEKEILKRREKDPSRKRDKETIEELREHRSINKAMCTTYAILSSSPFIIIENKEGMLENTVKKLEEVLL